MLFIHNKIRFFSLKTKLSLLYFLLLFISSVFISYYSYRSIWQLFLKDKEEHLRARAKPIIEHWLKEHNLTDEVSLFTFDHSIALPLSYDLTSRNTVALILNQNGEIIATGRRLKEEPVAPLPDMYYVRKALSGVNEVTYLTRVERTPVLVCLIPLRPSPYSDKIFGVIQISTTLLDIDRIFFHYGILQFIVLVITLLSGGLLGHWLINVNLKGLQSLSIACKEIAEGKFSNRLDDKIVNRLDEIGELAGAFNLMVVKLERLFLSQKRFVANAAHELLSPLTGLKGSLEVLLRGAQDDAKVVDRFSKRMHREVTHLIRICNQLLGLARIENSYNVNKQEVILHEFIHNFVENKLSIMHDNFCNYSINIEEGPFVKIRIDPDLLEQILFNILSNAIYYSSQESEILLGWEIITNYVRIWIIDHGVGMDKETLSHVFEPFFRGKDPVVRNIKGTGLGLSLTKVMVEIQGGEIAIESKKGEGTKVFFTLPL